MGLRAGIRRIYGPSAEPGNVDSHRLWVNYMSLNTSDVHPLCYLCYPILALSLSLSVSCMCVCVCVLPHVSQRNNIFCDLMIIKYVVLS